MNDFSVLAQEAAASMANLLRQFIEFLPTLVGVLAILIIGWIIAGLLRRLTRRILEGFNTVVDRNVEWGMARGLKLSATSAGLISSTVFWITLLFFITVATSTLGLDAFSVWLTKLIDYLPAAIVGIVIIIVGTIAGGWARETVTATAAAANIGQAANIGRLAQGITVIVSVVLGINQIGIDTELLVTTINIALASALGGMALAFGLGSRDLVANLIGAHHAERQFSPGDHVRIDDIEGVVTQITPTYLLVESKSGIARIPGLLFQQKPFVVRGGSADE